MVPAPRAPVNDPSKQASSADAAEYYIRYEIQFALRLGYHCRVAVPENLIVVGGNEDPVCIGADQIPATNSDISIHNIRMRITFHGGFGLFSALPCELPPTITSASSRLSNSIIS